MLPQNDIYKNNLRVYKKYRATLFPNKEKYRDTDSNLWCSGCLAK